MSTKACKRVNAACRDKLNAGGRRKSMVAPYEQQPFFNPLIHHGQRLNAVAPFFGWGKIEFPPAEAAK